MSVTGETVTFRDVVESFLTDRATLTRRGLNDRSRDAYRQDLTAWARQLHIDAGGDADEDVLRRVEIAALTDQNVRNAYRTLRESSAAATCQRRVGTLRLFTHWLQLEGHLLVDPTLRIEAPERPSRLPAGWSVDELRRLARVASTPREGNDRRRWTARDRAIFAVLVTTGVRAAELCGLTVGSIRREPDGETLAQVIGKGDKLIRSGVPVPAVQGLLGHEDLKTTGIYVKATAADTRDAVLLSPAREVLRETAIPTPD